MQLYAAIDIADPAAPSVYAKQLAQRLARETPEQVTAVMARNQRTNRMFIDWSQNNPAKTTIAPYSLRGPTTRPCPLPSRGTRSPPAGMSTSWPSPQTTSSIASMNTATYC